MHARGPRPLLFFRKTPAESRRHEGLDGERHKTLLCVANAEDDSERNGAQKKQTRRDAQKREKMSTTFANNIRPVEKNQHISEQAQERHKGERCSLPRSG